MLSLVEVIAFQAIVAAPGANICPRRKLPLMVRRVDTHCRFRASRARTCGQSWIGLFPLHPDRVPRASEEIWISL